MTAIRARVPKASLVKIVKHVRFSFVFLYNRMKIFLSWNSTLKVLPCDISSPCQNNGKCQNNLQGGYVCTCEKGYGGSDCSIGRNFIFL